MSTYINELPDDHREQVQKWFSKTSSDEQIESYNYMSSHYDKDFGHARSSDRCVDKLLEHMPETEGMRLLDAGCGTGFVAEYVREKYADKKMHIIGMDYCEAMMDKAREKGVYDGLFRADFSKPFPMPADDDAKCDGLVAAGVFVENHAEPCFMVNMAEHLRSGGVAVFSVRDTFYDRRQAEIDQAVIDSGFEVVSKARDDYWVDGTVTANYFVLRKL